MTRFHTKRHHGPDRSKVFRHVHKAAERSCKPALKRPDLEYGAWYETLEICVTAEGMEAATPEPYVSHM